MHVALCSMFRDARPYLDKFFTQAEHLKKALAPNTLRLILVEGDSVDGTRSELCLQVALRALSADLIARSHGGPKYGSVSTAQRWKQISYVMNGALDQIENEDIVIWVESDLIWKADTMLALIEHLKNVDAVAPMCFRGSRFYDVWGHRKNGRHFMTTSPYHPELGTGLTQIDSAGSCIAMRGRVARAARCDPEAGLDGGIVSFCNNLYQSGYSLWLDPGLRVHHPLPGSTLGACITTRNEVETIGGIVERLSTFGIEPIVVDAMSKDGTAAEAEAHGAIVVEHQCSMRDGLLTAWAIALGRGYDWILQLDAGGSHDPAQAEGMLKSRADMTLGSRFILPGSYQGRPWRRAASRAMAAICSAISGHHHTDWTSGYRLFSSELLAKLVAQEYYTEGHAWQIEVLGKAHQLGAQVVELPITYRAGRSSFSFRSALGALWALGALISGRLFQN